MTPQELGELVLQGARTSAQYACDCSTPFYIPLGGMFPRHENIVATAYLLYLEDILERDQWQEGIVSQMRFFKIPAPDASEQDYRAAIKTQEPELRKIIAKAGTLQLPFA